eukprot:2301923-Rhodomonas_salina.3
MATDSPGLCHDGGRLCWSGCRSSAAGFGLFSRPSFGDQTVEITLLLASFRSAHGCFLCPAQCPRALSSVQKPA